MHKVRLDFAFACSGFQLELPRLLGHVHNLHKALFPCATKYLTYMYSLPLVYPNIRLEEVAGVLQ